MRQAAELSLAHPKISCDARWDLKRTKFGELNEPKAVLLTFANELVEHKNNIQLPTCAGR